MASLFGGNFDTLASWPLEQTIPAHSYCKAQNQWLTLCVDLPCLQPVHLFASAAPHLSPLEGHSPS